MRQAVSASTKISRQVAVGVVDLLEIVQIDDRQRQLMAGAGDLTPAFTKDLVQKPPIAQTGQVIRIDQVGAHYGAGFLLHSHHRSPAGDGVILRPKCKQIQ